MAICNWCNKEMSGENAVKTCANNEEEGVMFSGGGVLDAIPFESDDGERCPDCNIGGGGFHHPGCDIEECPQCGGQLISCGCLDDEEDEFDYDENENDNNRS